MRIKVETQPSFVHFYRVFASLSLSIKIQIGWNSQNKDIFHKLITLVYLLLPYICISLYFITCLVLLCVLLVFLMSKWIQEFEFKGLKHLK